MTGKWGPATAGGGAEPWVPGCSRRKLPAVLPGN